MYEKCMVSPKHVPFTNLYRDEIFEAPKYFSERWVEKELYEKRRTGW
jgi:hypothetical protein